MRIYVVPEKGRRVTYFNAAGLRAVLPTEGASVEHSSFWLRRIADGDVVIGSPPPSEEEHQAEVVRRTKRADKE
jgi:hypothetical protein